MAVNLSKMKAIRDAFHRTPCVPDSDRYLAFEKTFTFDPTEDQITCFKVIVFMSSFDILVFPVRFRIYFLLLSFVAVPIVVI